MTTATYTIPDDPPDPETAGLELIVRLPQLLNTDAFTQVLQAYYGLMNNGLLSQTQVRGWVTNRFYYQRNIPIKDAVILAKLPGREARRQWVARISDHDGTTGSEGGSPPGFGLRTPVAFPNMRWCLRRLFCRRREPGWTAMLISAGSEHGSRR